MNNDAVEIVRVAEIDAQLADSLTDVVWRSRHARLLVSEDIVCGMLIGVTGVAGAVGLVGAASPVIAAVGDGSLAALRSAALSKRAVMLERDGVVGAVALPGNLASLLELWSAAPVAS